MATTFQWFLLTYLGFCAAWMDERPVLESRDGNLFISAAKDRNITLKILGNGCVNVNEINLLHVASAAQNATRLIERWRRGYLAEVETNLQRLTEIVEGPTGLIRSMALLRGTGEGNNTIQPGVVPSSQPPSRVSSVKVRVLTDRVRRLEDKVRSIETKLKVNDCQVNPCYNGGTCLDLYEGYQCHCPSNWEGPNCLTDVNECVRLLGTDLGCQNGATCINLPGSYRCDCASGWYGLHCTKKNFACSSQNSGELCGHGVCVGKPSSPLGYTCICDQGWQSDGSNPACTKDVDECAAKHPPCSVNPWVACRNAPGTFFCDPCPRGYTGNGYYCTDIDECLVDNGGCSTTPRVQCINTMGSRMCGPCPTGYRGDGVTCIYVGSCAINNGGCHPLATCAENAALTSAYVLCRCPAGFVGDGIGPHGCVQTTNVATGSACHSNPCVHGSCVATATSYSCTCDPGYTGFNCNVKIDPCTPNPCKNNGVCVISNGATTCDCPSTFTGSRCETPRQTCGGVSRNPVGHLEFPIGGNTYQHGLSCAWVLITNSTLVLNVTFSRFNLEHSVDCKYDFLQIHDGKNAGSQMIGRFCGNTLPNGDGNIVSTHNALYFWFHSDNSISHDGFALQWNTVEPVCGEILLQDYGTISSPGSPGRYPPNRDCYWTISVRETKRIQFLFGQMMIEEHSNCEKDYLKITGANDEVLGIYCNHSHPAPLITPGPEARLHFHSDSTGQDSGFQIHYSVVEGVPGCGGVYTLPSGMISSPSQLSTYLPAMECEWKIRMPPGERVQITWSKFELELSTSCRFDAVEIYDGGTRDAPLIGRYCGSRIPPDVKSTSNTLLVFFTSDWTYEYKGFTLTYSIVCDGEYSEETGVIHSPMYPNPYHKSRTCNYEIMQPPGKRIVLSIVDMDIEGLIPAQCHFDSLKIFDGDSENSTLLATLCGDKGQTLTEPYYSTHNYMYLRFTSDMSVQGRGFLANYTTIPSKCGGLFKTATGTIQTSNEDGYYHHNEDCVWTIQAPAGYFIQLTWLSFALESQVYCQHDFVKVYENYTASEGDILGTFCGSKKPPILMTQGRVMTIVFHSDSTIAHEGFIATYVFVDASKVCGGHFNKLNGVLKSPNYPDRYPNKKECTYVIEAPARQRVILNVKEFRLENSPSCKFDYLEIRNGGYETSPLIGKYCGSTIPTEIISQSNQLYLKFVTDYTLRMKGFYIEWDSTTIGCGGTLNAASGDIISPNYPQPYMQLANCHWNIAVAAGSVVQLLIVDLDIEQQYKCTFDYIEISEGIDRRNKQRYCKSPYPNVIQAKSNLMTVRFRSDFENSGRGFHLKYETLCQNKIHGFHGVIESPNFPYKYEHSLNCSWIIDAPIGNKINITFSHFDLEGMNSRNSCRYDYLDIKEGSNDVPSTDLATLCGSEVIPPKIHSSQHQVFVTFVTDNLIAFNGFRLEWVVDGCGGHLTRPFDSFTSPGYPSVYPNNVDCEWLIEVDYSHSIDLTIHDINTEKQRGCYFDKLAIYSGEDAEAPKLGEICYSEKPVVYTSFGNKMFLKFSSDVTYAARGFNISYKSVPLICGGRFTADNGIIYSTNYPKNYPNKQNCEWLIQVDQNYVVNFTFLDFDLEENKNCTDDYVHLYDGPTRDSPLLGSHCGNELPPSYVSTANEMLVVMRTDSYVTAKGFKGRYRRACGARIIVRDEGYLSPAASRTDMDEDNTNCTWTLIAEDPADHVTVTFTHLELDVQNVWWNDDCSQNHVEIFEGETVTGPSVGKWCDSVFPLPITSTGNALTVHLFSMYDFLGHLAVTYSVLNSACGGTYTSYHGKIASPGYPNTYPLNVECIWILNNSPGNRLSLTFSEFDLQQSENCDLDYLEIREDSGIGKLISISCGTSIEPVRSSSKLWIKFKSDGTGVGKGFVGEYVFNGGNELTGPSGRITSPLYPMPYRMAETLSWRVTVDFGWVIQIDIKDVFIENADTLSNCYSSLTIYDGYDNEAPSLLEVCNRDAAVTTTTSSNVVFIEMMSETFRMGSWFDLTWLRIPKDTNRIDDPDVTLSNCSKEISFMDQTYTMYDFSSPGWPHGYDSNLQCSWLFTSPPGTHLVLRVAYMDLEDTLDCVADAVSVYSGNALATTNDATLLQRLCLANSTLALVKASNVMTVKFESDGYVNKTGFSAYVYCDCGGKLEGPNGVIEINNSTSIRQIRTWQFSCEWTVEVRPGRMIEVTITEMSIQQGPSFTCTDNYIMLKNGEDAMSPLLGVGKYCGNVAPATLRTTGNRLYVKASGMRYNLKFKLEYKEISNRCGGEFVLSDQQKSWEISTPNYPNIPSPFTECTWTVLAPSRERISLHFIERFDLRNSLNCEREYVEVRDGGLETSKLLGRYCKDVAPSSMSSTGNMMFVHFYTDVPEPKNGFKARFAIGEVCGGIIRGNSGTISSPNYPFFYPKNVTCSWMIVAPVDHYLKIEFVDMHLFGLRRCEAGDHVTISEKVIAENETFTEIGSYCSTTLPDPIETSSNVAKVTFKSDNIEYTTLRGFSLKFTSSQEVCGGEFTAKSGTIKSNGYPNVATRSRYCDWRIKLPRGFQVVVDILDLDITAALDSRRLSYALSFYNDFRFKSRIKIVNNNSTIEQVRSSSNTMMIGYSSSPGYRGFKLRYHGVAPAPCGGIINNINGSISAPKVAPFNESSYYCQWSMEAPRRMATNGSRTGVTLSIKVNGLVGGVRGYHYTRFCYVYQYISLSDVGMLCGNFTEPVYLRSPKPVNELTIVNGTYGAPMHFTLDYQWQPCGGILRGLTHVITAPKNIPYPINCAWYAHYPDTGEMIQLEFTKLNLTSCEKGYISVRNGDAFSPEIGKFCGNVKPYNITSTSNQLWIEYFATSEPNDFEFVLKPANNGCGGALRGTSKEISSPQFPKQYPNNAECTWEITAENGFHVGLEFVQRFNLESSTNCAKDSIEIFDWITDPNNGNGNWKTLGKVCGRNSPAPFNTTSNRMKVTFRSNEAIQGDGFRALWHENCGGIFEVTTTPKIIQSPAYPNYYRPSLFCNYTLVAPDKDIIIEFMEFQLEHSRGDCRFDNLTIKGSYRMYEEESTYCGDNKPPPIVTTDKAEIIFNTDKYIQRNGFVFKYFLKDCGGTLRNPGEIKSLSNGKQYVYGQNCIWDIEAPADKSIVLRFEYFIVEHHRRCLFDYVEVYDGNSTEDSSNKLAKLCGNLTEHLPVLQSSSNHMVVSFTADGTNNEGGFKAKVLFVKSTAAGCGGNVNLTATSSVPFKTQQGSTYESFEDCHWIVETLPGKHIKLTINSIDVKNATNTTRSNQCSGDYLEVRDGSGPFSELLGRYCGSEVPLPILSSLNKLWIRFYSDGTEEGAGISGTLKTIDSLCGLAEPILNGTKHVLTSPNYPNSFLPGTKCRWLLKFNEEAGDRINIQFIDFDIADSARCDNDYLEITDARNRKYIEQGFGEDFVWSGHSDIHYYNDNLQPSTSYKYCGNSLPNDFYSYSTAIEVKFQGETSGHKGFKFKYGVTGCDRNFTAEQGRIVHESFGDCWITITAPESSTISLYFNDFIFYDPGECTKSSLQVFDGSFNGNLLASLCGVTTPNPIFSTTNKLSIHSWSQWQRSFEQYDITYTTTTAGRGCGGKIFNYLGSFSSPMYPNEYRNNTVCTWDISVPRALKVHLSFTAFDLGGKKNCERNFLQIFDVTETGDEIERNLYCGGDDPAPVEADGNRVKVTYTSTVNNVGTGWLILFKGVA